VVGVVVTAIAFCFGTYYAVLAVSAYSRHRDIESLARESKDTVSKIEEMEEQLEKKIHGVSEQYDQMYRQMDAVFASLIVSFKYSEMLPLDNKEKFFRLL
jgi:hypothetical protein